MDGCVNLSSSSANLRCYTAVSAFAEDTHMVHTLWANRVMASGGAESTKNTLEQTNYGEIEWIKLGMLAGLAELFPERFDADGYEVSSCTTTAGVTSYAGSDDHTTCVDAWKATQTGAALCTVGSGDSLDCNDTANVRCFPGNNSSLTAYVSTADIEANCSLVEL